MQPQDQTPVGGEEQFLVITGMSGAGKSKAVIALEDMGFFCVDNLPPNLLGKFFEGMRLTNRTLPRMAVVADIRSGPEALPELEAALDKLREAGVEVRLLFIEASDAVIVRRYKENRRPHPLARNSESSLTECIRLERGLLAGLRGQADIVIDTSETVDRSLREKLTALFGENGEEGFPISVTSFGFKFGLPIDADMVADVRFLPNPYYVPKLKDLTGLDGPVADYVLENDVSKTFLRRYMDLLFFLIPNYQNEGKKNLMIAVGCTGGRHRSVAIAEVIGKRLRKKGYRVKVNHRDMESRNGKG